MATHTLNTPTPRRQLFGASAALLMFGAAPVEPAMAADRDAELFALCAQLTAQKTEWRRLHALTSPAEGSQTPADAVFEAYHIAVWPHASDSLFHPPSPDLAARLLDLRATTPEGVQAKAAAILAIDDAGGYLRRGREDILDLVFSLLRDSAGPSYQAPGTDGVLMAASARPAAVIAHADAEIIAACARFTHLEDEYARLCKATDWPANTPKTPEMLTRESEFDTVATEQLTLGEWLAEQTPRTPHGAQARAKAALIYMGDSRDDEDMIGRLSYAIIDALAGEG